MNEIEQQVEADAVLLAAVQRGDAEAFDAFVERYGRRLMAFGLRMCGHREDAEDVFQETLLKAYTGLADIREPRAVRTWLFRVAANACLMKRRKAARAREIGLDDLKPPGWEDGAMPDIPDWSMLPEGSAAQTQLRGALEGRLKELPADYRIVLLLRDVEGLSTREAAEALEIREPAVKMRLHRARMMMRELLSQRWEATAKEGGP